MRRSGGKPQPIASSYFGPPCWECLSYSSSGVGSQELSLQRWGAPALAHDMQQKQDRLRKLQPLSWSECVRRSPEAAAEVVDATRRSRHGVPAHRGPGARFGHADGVLG